MRRKQDDISHVKLLKASLSASVQNAAGPIGLALQHVILGKRKSSAVLAAFGVCVSISNLGTTVFQFLVDGSTSQVGSLVAKHLDENDEGKKKTLLEKHCKKCLVVSVLAGATAGAILLFSGNSLFSTLGETDQMDIGRGYYAWRCLSMPFKTSSNAAVGIIGGYGHVHVVSVMNSVVAFLQVLMVCVVLNASSSSEGKGEKEALDALGLAYFVVVMFHAVLGWAIVYFSRPKKIGLERTVRRRRREMRRRREAFEEEGEEEEEEEEESKKYFVDALNMFGRSILLQLSFFIAMIVASRKLPVAGLAAHHLTAQLWLVCSYIVDGFATIGTIYGSRLYSIKSIKKLRSLTVRLLSYGVSLGFFFCVIFLAFGSEARKLFAGDEQTNYYLGKTWMLVTFAQPVNAVVFVLDGLMYATKSFAFAREVMVAGVGVVFLPTILSATLINDGNSSSGAKVIARVWTAKLALNVWRMLFLSGRVFFWILKEEDRSDQEGEEEEEEENEEETSDSGSDGEDTEESLLESDIDDDAPLLSL